MLKALIFDFDGVIIDTETQWYEIYRDWLKKEYNYTLDVKDYLVCVGSNSQSLFAFLKKNISPEVDGEAFEKSAADEFIRRCSTLPPMSGVPELIIKAKHKNLSLALATSATKNKPLFHLKRLGLLECFDALATAEIYEHIKPAPDPFLKAAELLHVSPAECLAVEDSANGLCSANRAGMRCLLVPNNITRYCEFAPCYMRVNSLAEVDLSEIQKDFI